MHADMFVEGALEYEEVEQPLSAALDCFREAAAALPEATGTLVMRMAVGASGEVSGITFLTDTLVPRVWEGGLAGVEGSGPTSTRARVKQAAVQCFQQHPVPRQGPCVERDNAAAVRLGRSRQSVAGQAWQCPMHARAGVRVPEGAAAAASVSFREALVSAVNR